VTRDFNAALAAEFPELIEDSDRVQRGEKPLTQLYQRTARVFHELVTAGPALFDEGEAILAAARIAKEEMFAAVAKELDVRLGREWRPYLMEMLRLMAVARETHRTDQPSVDFMELLYLGARYGSFSRVNVPASSKPQ
jgi:hypothetical protein